MQKQHFTFKMKYEYLPQFIKDVIDDRKIEYSAYDIYFINQKYLRKLKIENIENKIKVNDKKLLEYLINEDVVQFLTQEEVQNKLRYNSGASGSQGTSGTSGKPGTSGVSGVSGVSGSAGSAGSVGIGLGVYVKNPTKSVKVLPILQI